MVPSLVGDTNPFLVSPQAGFFIIVIHSEPLAYGGTRTSQHSAGIPAEKGISHEGAATTPAAH